MNKPKLTEKKKIEKMDLRIETFNEEVIWQGQQALAVLNKINEIIERLNEKE